MDIITKVLGTTDIYVIDQIMKGRYKATERILDAGCGNGRNLSWFLHAGAEIYGIDQDSVAIANIVHRFPDLDSRFYVGSLEAMPFEDDFFDHIISSAVLHFANGTEEFWQLFSEHLRILRADGTFFMRMASDIGIASKLSPSHDGVYKIPDGSERFLLTRDLLHRMLSRFDIRLIEPLKTTNVADLRCMSTLIFKKA